VFLYSSDRFVKPYPFRADIAVSIDDVFDKKLAAVHELASQVYEGGASGSETFVRSVPPASDEAGRRAWLKEKWSERQGNEADKFRAALVEWYGEERGKAVKYAETFEVCEYGRQPTRDELKKLFPFFD
jgi:hypothetical protein